MLFFYVYHFLMGAWRVYVQKYQHLSIAPSIQFMMFRCISCLNMLLTHFSDVFADPPPISYRFTLSLM